MNITLTENSIMELLHTRVTHRPAIVLEGYHHLSTTEQQQIDESYNAVYDLLMDQVITEMSIGGAKAKLKGAVAGAKAGFQGDQNAGNVGKNTEIQSLFDDVKKNIGTIVAQHKNDLAKMGMSAEDPAMQKLASMEQAISSGGSGIEVKDNSAMAKAKQFGAEKVLPVVMKAVSPVMKKVEDLYNKSGPIKDFDTKYQQLVTQFTEKHPNMAEPISKFSEMAKKHKGKATFIIGGLTALLTATGALAAGGVGAFVIGVGLRGIYGVLAGEPPAKAFGKAAITAAVGKLVGGAFKDLFGDVDLSGADEVGTKQAIGQATGAMDAGDVDMDSYEDLVAKGGVNPDDPNSFLGEPDKLSRQDFLSRIAQHGEDSVSSDDIADFKLSYAQDYAKQAAESLPGTQPVTPEMLQKIQDHITIDTSSGQARVNIDGTFTRGNIFLTSDELAEFNANFQGMDKLTKSTEWLRSNVEGADSQLAQADAAAEAQAAARQAKYDALSPEEQAEWDRKQAELDDLF